MKWTLFGILLFLASCTSKGKSQQELDECLGFFNAMIIDSAAIKAFKNDKSEFADEALCNAAMEAMQRQIEAIHAAKVTNEALAKLKPRFVAARTSHIEGLTQYRDGSAKLAQPDWVPPNGFAESLGAAAKAVSAADKEYLAIVDEAKRICGLP
ncbi:MAG: hypothetical protein FWG75_03960 [Cystobacterineae bacterium]|nr:hypothetical protein [Cystobacterineae bacterium]